MVLDISKVRNICCAGCAANDGLRNMGLHYYLRHSGRMVAPGTDPAKEASLTKFTQSDNRDQVAMESYYVDSIKALRAEVRRLTLELQEYKNRERAFSARLNEVLRKQAEK